MGTHQQRKGHQEGPVRAWFMNLFAAMIFGIPTALILVLLANRELALWGAMDTYIGSSGFWSIILFFAITATLLPKLFPSMLGKLWRFIIYFERP